MKDETGLQPWFVQARIAGAQSNAAIPFQRTPDAGGGGTEEGVCQPTHFKEKFKKISNQSMG